MRPHDETFSTLSCVKYHKATANATVCSVAAPYGDKAIMSSNSLPVNVCAWLTDCSERLCPATNRPLLIIFLTTVLAEPILWHYQSEREEVCPFRILKGK